MMELADLVLWGSISFLYLMLDLSNENLPGFSGLMQSSLVGANILFFLMRLSMHIALLREVRDDLSATRSKQAGLMRD